jgi:hypothetical protein
MTTDPAETPPTIHSRSAFADALRWAFARAVRRHARHIVCIDPHFADWPLDDAALLESLTQWLKTPQRRIVLLADSYDEMARRHPRFVRWRGDWVHAVDAQVPADEDRGELPRVWVDDDSTSVELIDAVHWNGHAMTDSRVARLWRERIDALLQRSQPGMPLYRTGL